MSIGIHGMGWATPLGRDLIEVWRQLQAGIAAPVAELENPFSGERHAVRMVPPDTVVDATRIARLRRSSTISHLAIAAALDAMSEAKCDPRRERVALIFATTNGGVIYTRRFFAGVAEAGAQAGSPLLFPETVYNAPASHIAATLGIDGASTTLVNDATAGVDAIAAAVDLLECDACDHCLVVAAEEADWIICEGYHTWKSLHIPVFGEGAAALVLGRSGVITVRPPKPCRTFHSPGEASNVLRKLCEDSLAGASPALIISPASGASVDESGPWESPSMMPKRLMGEAFAASTLMAVVCAAMAAREGAGSVLVPVIGFHGQVGAISLHTS